MLGALLSTLWDIAFDIARARARARATPMNDFNTGMTKPRDDYNNQSEQIKKALEQVKMDNDQNHLLFEKISEKVNECLNKVKAEKNQNQYFFKKLSEQVNECHSDIKVFQNEIQGLKKTVIILAVIILALAVIYLIGVVVWFNT